MSWTQIFKKQCTAGIKNSNNFQATKADKPSYKSLSQRHRDDLAARLPAFLTGAYGRRSALARSDRTAFGASLRAPRRKSPWHARRLTYRP